jgi:hypothetical protein
MIGRFIHDGHNIWKLCVFGDHYVYVNLLNHVSLMTALFESPCFPDGRYFESPVSLMTAKCESPSAPMAAILNQLPP